MAAPVTACTVKAGARRVMLRYMTVANALDFIGRCRAAYRSADAASESLDGLPGFSDLLKLADQWGYRLGPEELLEAHALDWQMRAALYAHRSQRSADG